MIPRIDEVKWQEVGHCSDTAEILLAEIIILGCSMHLHAYAITERDPDEYAESGNAIHDAVGDGEPWTEVTINGRAYVLVATPYCT